TADGQLDRPSLERLVTRLLEAGVDGIFALGSSGEIAFFDDAQRAEVLEAVTGTVAGQVPVIAGVIDTQTRRVIQHLRAAERFDLGGYVATAPFYAVTGPEEIDAPFPAVAAAADAPAWAYDIPVCVHAKPSPQHLVALGADGVIPAAKASRSRRLRRRRPAGQ